MAIVLDTDCGGKFYEKYGLWFRDPEEGKKIKAYRDLYDAKELEMLGQLRREGRKSFWKNTLELPKKREHVPDALVLEKGVDLPDIALDTCAGRLVSEEFRTLVEKIEPEGAGFSFFEIAIFRKDGTPFPRRYFHWDVYRKVDAIDGSRDGVKTVMGAPTGTHRWTYAGGGTKRTRDHLAVQSSVVADLAAWTDFRFGETKVFVSDALFDAMRLAAITGFQPESEWAEL